MKIGAALFLVAVGAILRFAIATTMTHGVDLQVVGDILMVVGLVGLFIWLLVWAPRSRSQRSAYPPAAPPPVNPEDRSPAYRGRDGYERYPRDDGYERY